MRLDLSLPVILIAIAETLIWAALFYTFPILLLHWEADFGWGREEIAAAFTLALVVAALGSPIAGRLIDRGLSRISFPVAAFFGGGVLFALSMAETRLAFFGCWALIGLASSACLYEPCFAFLTRRKGADARGAITTVTLVAGFASTLCFPLADWLADAWGWRTALMVFAAIACFGAAPLFAIATSMMEGRTTARPTRKENDEARAAARAAMRRPTFWLLAGSFPLLAITHGMTISHLMPILADRGASDASAVLAASLIGPCQVLGRIVITAFAGGKTAAAITQIAFFGIVIAMGLFLAAHSEALIFFGVAVFGGAYGVLSITRPLVAADFLGRIGFGAISGALALAYIACAAAAPTLAALFWRAGGYDLTLTLGAGFAVAGMLLLWLAGRSTKTS